MELKIQCITDAEIGQRLCSACRHVLALWAIWCRVAAVRCSTASRVGCPARRRPAPERGPGATEDRRLPAAERRADRPRTDAPPARLRPNRRPLERTLLRSFLPKTKQNKIQRRPCSGWNHPAWDIQNMGIFWINGEIFIAMRTDKKVINRLAVVSEFPEGPS